MHAYAARIGNDLVFMVVRMGVASSSGSLLPAVQMRYVTFVAGFRQMTLAGAISWAASGQDGQSREAPRGSRALG